MALTNDDKVEIQELISRYNKAIDTGDAESWAATFTDDGEFVGLVGTFHGAEELRPSPPPIPPRRSTPTSPWPRTG